MVLLLLRLPLLGEVSAACKLCASLDPLEAVCETTRRSNQILYRTCVHHCQVLCSIVLQWRKSANHMHGVQAH